MTILSRRMAISVLSASVPFLVFSRAAVARTVVKVTLWDKGETSMDMMDGMMPMGMAMPGANMGMVTMGITVNVTEVPAGEVAFNVVNDSLAFYHSMTISPVADLTKELPYLIDAMMVDEDAIGRTAKGADLKPHSSGTVTVEMTPGTYILYCNIAGHYMMGMWTLITVTG